MKILLTVLFSFEIANSFNIDCNYQNQNILHYGSVYACIARIIPTTLGNTVTSITGTHWTGRNNNNVEYITMHGNWTLNFFPQGFSHFFPNIRGFTIYSSTFDTLYGDEFSEFKNLQWIYFSQSNLTTITSRLFERTPNLTYIEFRSTMLERVGYDLFTPLNIEQLIWVGFLYAPCINKIVTNGNQTLIQEIINELRENCPYYG